MKARPPRTQRGGKLLNFPQRILLCVKSRIFFLQSGGVFPLYLSVSLSHTQCDVSSVMMNFPENSFNILCKWCALDDERTQRKWATAGKASSFGGKSQLKSLQKMGEAIAGFAPLGLAFSWGKFVARCGCLSRTDSNSLRFSWNSLILIEVKKERWKHRHKTKNFYMFFFVFANFLPPIHIILWYSSFSPKKKKQMKCSSKTKGKKWKRKRN